MTYELLYWEKSEINQPSDGEHIIAIFKGGDIKSFHYMAVNKEWFIRNVAEWLANTGVPYGKLNKSFCAHCGDIVEHVYCKSCEMQLTMPTEEY